ncbi:MAG TPA: 16S rRNA (guanine(527)-N(7))-methyltransferase RsmG [Limnobacter sp.]|uniref:16S rRNA (guanine(527)-N(7))-methyltransferase RsmG n=1 Tax=Limnobacter sp. TaxID=2003368 RepID=UPI002EDB4A35
MSNSRRPPPVLGAVEQGVLEQGISALGLSLSSTQTRQLFDYAKLLQKWNQVINLTAIRQPQDIVTHHLLDSLAVLPALSQTLQGKADPTLLDVGAGAGLPGLVLAIAQPSWQVSLVDTVQKKVAFVQQAIGVLGLKNARAVHARVEELQHPPFDLICSRAFSSLALFISLSQHLLAPYGVFAALKGRVEVDRDVPEGWQVSALHSIEVPFLDEDRHLFIIQR